MPWRAARPERGCTSPTVPGGRATAMPVGTRARSPGASVTSATLVRSAPASPSVLYTGTPASGWSRRMATGTRAAAVTICVRRASCSGGALPADQDAGLLAGELAAVVHQETPGTRELVGLAREDPHRELLAGQVCARELEALGLLGLVDVDARGALVDATALELLDGVLGQLVVRLARCVVVGCHFRLSTLRRMTRP